MKTFAELFQQELLTRQAQAPAPTNSREARGPMPGCYVQLATQSSVPRICDLCWANSRDYGFETVAKKKAIEDWLAQSRDLPRQNHVYASLKGRHYRSVSKRRWFFLTNGKAAARIAEGNPGVRNPSGFLGMPQTGRQGSDRGWSVQACQLEPASHREIFDYLQSQLPVKEVQDLLNYVIVKDTNLKPPAPSEDGEAQPAKKSEIQAVSIIFNIRHLGQKRGVWNVLSKKLTKKFPPPDVRKELQAKAATAAEEVGAPPRILSSTSVISVWLVEGDANDDHYQQIQPRKFVRLYGDTCIRDSFGFGFSPLGFTQVNPHCVATMVDWTQRNTQKGVNIADFFCGYGLLGIQAAQAAQPRRLIGLESSQEAIEWARRNQRRLPETTQARFQQSDLISSSGSKLERLLENVMEPPQARPRAGQKAAPARSAAPANEPWQVIVDPPRIGLDAKLIETILTLNPTQVIHFVCNADLLFDQVKLWKAQGYHVEKLAVFDMFPGTDHLEIGMVLKPKRH